MYMESNLIGRPQQTVQYLETVVQKLEPYLKQGLSVRKACLLAEIPHTAVYSKMAKLNWFSDRIDACRTYKANLVSGIFMLKLEEIAAKQALVLKLRQVLRCKNISDAKRLELTDQLKENGLKADDYRFLQWLAINDRDFRGLYGVNTDKGDGKKNNEDVEMIIARLDMASKPTDDYSNLAENIGKRIRGEPVFEWEKNLNRDINN